MVKSFGIPEESIGYNVGLIASSFALAQFITSYWWGQISDKYGRRPVLLFGLLGSTITTTLFGLSKSLVWAIATRTFCGLLNGNVGVAKSILGEISTEKQKGVAFSLIGLSFGVGMIIGPALGGLLSNPAENIPSLFGGNKFLKEYPYFLPCLCSSFFSLIGFVIGYFYLPETAGFVPTDEEDEDIEVEDDTLLGTDQNVSEEMPLLNSPSENSGLSFQAKSCIFAYALLAFQGIIIYEVFPLWTVSNPPIGLAWNSKDLGILLSVTGVVSFVCQLIFYPFLSRNFKPLTLYRYPILLYPVFYTIYPMISSWIAISELYNKFVFPLMLVLNGFKCIVDNIVFTSVMILINNSAKRGQLGKVNGTAQGTAALTRSIGPTLAGTIWAWSNTNGVDIFPLNHYLIFVFNVFLSIGLAIHAFWMLGDDLNVQNLTN